MLARMVFARLQATFGTQFLQLWRGSEMELVYAEWEEALAGVARDRVKSALDECRKLERPPTLPAFLAICRGQPSSSDRPRIVYDTGAPTDREKALENLRRVKAMLAAIGEGGRRDPMRWAKHPKSEAAVALLLRAAARDHRLREIVRGHVMDGGERLPTDGAAAMILAALESDPSMASTSDEPLAEMVE